MSWIGENLGTLVALLLATLLVFGLAPRLVPRIGAINLNGNKVTIIAAVVFVILAIAVYLIGTPTMRGTWEYGKAHWPMIIFLSLVGYIIAMLLPDGATDAEKSRQKKIKNVIQAIAVVIPVFYFIMAPLGMKAEEWTLPTVTCPDTTRKTQSCLLNTRWTNWIKPGGGIADNGLTPCYSNSEEIVAEFADFAGTTHYRFRAKTGQVAMSYAALDISATKQCPLTLPS